MRTPVTADHAVLTAMIESEHKAFTSKGVGKLLDLTPFQITARLKGMENRLLVVRNGKTSSQGKALWTVTDEGCIYQKSPPPPPTVRISRSKYGGSNPPPARPLDIDVPHINRARLSEGWKVDMLEIDGYTRDLFTSPLGTKFILASHLETANLIFDPSIVGLKPMRLKLYVGSHEETQHQHWVLVRKEAIYRMRFSKKGG